MALRIDDRSSAPWAVTVFLSRMGVHRDTSTAGARNLPFRLPSHGPFLSCKGSNGERHFNGDATLCWFDDAYEACKEPIILLSGTVPSPLPK